MLQYLIVDIDNTLSDARSRADSYLGNFNYDWDSFYEHCGEDFPISQNCELVQRLAKSGLRIIFLTGRPESVRSITERWLCQYLSPDVVLHSKLIMRPTGTFILDVDFKRKVWEDQLCDSGITIDNCIILEDSTRVISMWRSLGFVCYSVSNPCY